MQIDVNNRKQLVAEIPAWRRTIHTGIETLGASRLANYDPGSVQ